MINDKKVKRYCSDDMSLIENYELAVSDTTQTWHCHHRKETDEGVSADKLKEMGLYYNRPSTELIFLTESQHRSLHGVNAYVETRNKISRANTGSKRTTEQCKHISEARIGKNIGCTPWMKGKHHSEESKRKISESQIGRTPWNKGKVGVQIAWNKGLPMSDDVKKKLSESKIGKKLGGQNPSARKVLQIDINTLEVIQEWECVKYAADFFGITHSAIILCCKGKNKTCRGFIWRYAE